MARGQLSRRDAPAAQRRRRRLLGRAALEIQERRAARVARAHGGARLDRARMAEGVRRRRLEQGRSARAARGDGAPDVPRAADLVRHLDARPGAARSTATRSRSASTCRRSCAARSAGARATPSPAPAPTSRRSRRAPTTDGDHYVVNGQKIWTSYGDKADWIFCLVRTDSAAKKHDGISFLLFDMQSPGVSTQPIRLISGYSPFCETFFDNVQVPRRTWSASSTRAGRSRSTCSARAQHDRRHRHAAADAAQPARDQEHRARVAAGSPKARCAPTSRASRWMRRRSR